jgi:hypothetical protein
MARLVASAEEVASSSARPFSSRSSIRSFAAISGSSPRTSFDEALGVLAADERLDGIPERMVGTRTGIEDRVDDHGAER